MAFEHLKPDEVAIFSAALAKGLFPGKKSYDVHVGEGYTTKRIDVTPEEAQIFKRLTQKRIDVIHFDGGQIDIIEVTPRLSSRCIGQLLSYKQLYIQKFQPEGRIFMHAVVSETDRDLEAVAEAQGIEVHVV